MKKILQLLLTVLTTLTATYSATGQVQSAFLRLNDSINVNLPLVSTTATTLTFKTRINTTASVSTINSLNIELQSHTSAVIHVYLWVQELVPTTDAVRTLYLEDRAVFSVARSNYVLFNQELPMTNSPYEVILKLVPVQGHDQIGPTYRRTVMR